MRLLVDCLIHERGHHRITIDPAVANTRAVRCYESVGFRPVGMLRQYERDPSGTAHDGLLMERLADDEGPRLRAAVPTLPVSDERRAVTFLEAALGLIEVGPGLASAVGTVSSCTCGWPPTATHGAPSVTWLAQGPAGSRSAASISSTRVPAAGCGAPQRPADGHRLGDGRVRGVRPGRQPADRVRTTAVIGDYAGWRAAAHYPQRSKPCNGSSVIIGLPCQTPGVPAPGRRGGAAGLP